MARPARPGTRCRRLPDRAERLLRHGRARPRLLPPAPPCRHGREGQRRRQGGVAPARQPGALPLQRPDRHHPDRRARRRLWRRHPGRGPGRLAADARAAGRDRRAGRGGRRGRAHHLPVADRRRARAQADRARQPRAGRRLRGAADDGARPRRRARGGAARGLLPARPAPARASRGAGAAGHRGGDPDAGGRGGEHGRGRAAGDPDDRARAEAGRPLRACADDTAPGGGLGRPRPGAAGCPGAAARQPARTPAGGMWRGHVAGAGSTRCSGCCTPRTCWTR
jgi:hypothetical protein